jgi:hypothetical protein
MKIFSVLLFCITTCILPVTVSAQRASSLQQSDMYFVKNNGQLRDSEGNPCPHIEYVAESKGLKVFFSKQGVSYVLFENKKRENKSLESRHPLMSGLLPAAREIKVHKVNLDIVDGNSDVRILPGEQASYRSTYYTSSNPNGIKNVPAFRTLVYKNIYQNIDLVFYQGQDGLKYDLVVNPGGRVADIRFRYSGADNITLSAAGSLRITTSVGTIEEQKPVTYQEHETTTATVNGRRLKNRKEVTSGFRFRNNELRFDVGAFDSKAPLVIDPQIRWLTYVGGNSNDAISDRIIVDQFGYLIVRGETSSADFPVSTTSTLHGSNDAFVAKFTKGGQKVWAVYFGGNNIDSERNLGDIGVDSVGNIFLMGSTSSATGFPVTSGTFQQTYGGGSFDAYVAKLDYTGSLIWATYCGGSGRDVGYGLAVDRDGNVIISGETESSNFPASTGAYKTAKASGDFADGFLAKFSGSSGQRLWATYYGGSANYAELAWSVIADKNNDLIVTGMTSALNFPVTSGAIQTTYAGGIFDAFIAKFGTGGNLIWSTYYGGGHTDAAYNADFDSQNNIIVVGGTGSYNFPVSTTAIQTTLKGTGNYYDCFILKLDSNGQRLWATYYGGTVADMASAITIDSEDNIVVTGFTTSTNFSVTVDAEQTNLRGSQDAFLLKLNSQGQMLYASYVGGSNIDDGLGVAVDLDDNPIIAGYTQSTNLSTSVTAFQPHLAGGTDGFLVKFGPCSLTPVITTPFANTVCPDPSVVVLDAGEYNVYRWSNGATTRMITVTGSGTYTVTVEDNEGCSATSAPVVLTFP